MILTKTNLKQWKKALDKECKRRHLYKLSETRDDIDWMEDIGADTAEVVSDEIYYASQEG